MNGKIKLIIISVIVFTFVSMLVCLHLLYKKTNELEKDRDRWKNNTEVLYNKQQDYIINDSISVSRQKALEMKVKEYESLNKDFEKQIKSLKSSSKIKPIKHNKTYRYKCIEWPTSNIGNKQRCNV